MAPRPRSPPPSLPALQPPQPAVCASGLRPPASSGGSTAAGAALCPPALPSRSQGGAPPAGGLPWPSLRCGLGLGSGRRKAARSVRGGLACSEPWLDCPEKKFEPRVTGAPRAAVLGALTWLFPPPLHLANLGVAAELRGHGWGSPGRQGPPGGSPARPRAAVPEEASPGEPRACPGLLCSLVRTRSRGLISANPWHRE